MSSITMGKVKELSIQKTQMVVDYPSQVMGKKKYING